MTLTYRTKRKLQRIGLITLIVLLVSILVWFCWVIWAERYVVYTREGATLNFELSDNVGQGNIAAPPSAGETISIFYNEGANAVDSNADLTQISGYYIDSDTLQSDLAGARDVVATLTSGTAVMVDVKNAKGSFYYTSSLSDAVQSTSVDRAAVDSLITDITSRNLYAIAVVPAFRDYSYGLNHTSSGLEAKKASTGKSAGYLWADEDYCYWLDPTSAGTINWLKSIIEELRDLGFDEVVFTNFCFPNTSSIVFDGDQAEAINNAAATLVTACASDSFAISFMTSDSSFTLPEGRSRLYLENISANNVDAAAVSHKVLDATANLVFMATTNDTRFNAYSVIRSINSVVADGQ